MSEEVDEINEYLKARRQKQELGELPKTDFIPPFVSRLSRALFGEKQKAKVPLQSMQPTYVSVQAQHAVRQQLDEIMRTRQLSASLAQPPLSSRSPPPSPPLAAPPQYPFHRTLPTVPAVPALSTSPSPVISASRSSAFPLTSPKPPSSFLGFWKKQTPAPALAQPTQIVSPPTRSTIPSFPTPTRTAPLSSYSQISSVQNQKLARESSTPSPIQPVNVSPSLPATSPSPARSAYAPPWVTRTQPNEGFISPPLNRTTTPPYAIPSLPVTRAPSSASPSIVSTPSLTVEKKEERVMPRVFSDSALPPAALDESPSFSTPRERTPHFPSGEVRVEELEHLPPSDSLQEEISEEEAIEKLPFEEVEGLSASDLAYLEKKEKEHAQSHDEELWDQSNPSVLKTKLEAQSNPLLSPASPPSFPSSPDDPKKDILRRLKKMMEEERKTP
jgi:hypothetical protein